MPGVGSNSTRPWGKCYKFAAGLFLRWVKLGVDSVKKRGKTDILENHHESRWILAWCPKNTTLAQRFSKVP